MHKDLLQIWRKGGKTPEEMFFRSFHQDNFLSPLNGWTPDTAEMAEDFLVRTLRDIENFANEESIDF